MLKFVVIFALLMIIPTSWCIIKESEDDEQEYLIKARERKHRIMEEESKVLPQRQLNPSIGTFRTLVLLVRFTDHIDRVLPDKSHYETICNEQLVPYLTDQSYGQFNTVCDVQDWITTDNTEAYYAAGVSNLKTSETASEFFIPVLNKLDEQGIDWLQYDTDWNGNIDSLLVIHSGYGAEQIGTASECGTNPPPNRIYSQGHRGSNGAWNSKDYSTYLSGYAIAPAFDGVCTNKPVAMGVMTHELTHTFGTPDLYDKGPDVVKFIGGIAFYCIMSNAIGPKGNGTPASMSAYTKVNIGWVQPIEILYNGVYEIRVSNQHPDIYIISTGFPENEYLLIENRAKSGYDTDMPGSGILMYHIDNAVPSQDTPGYPGQNNGNWPENGKHYQVALLQADGNYDLEKDINNGDDGDYWKSGNILKPGNNQYPNSDSYQNGIIQQTGITISDFSDPGYTMTFTVSGLADPPTEPTTSAPVAAPKGAPTYFPFPAPISIPQPTPPTASPMNAPQPTNPPIPPPTTNAPIPQPTAQPIPPPTKAPIPPPTKAPTTNAPIPPPTAPPRPPPTKAPSPAPTKAPTTNKPIPSPTTPPIPPPTATPRPPPTKAPTPAPTKAPIPPPTATPRSPPTKAPTPAPTKAPVNSPPTKAPTPRPTNKATSAPLNVPPPTASLPTTPAPTNISFGTQPNPMGQNNNSTTSSSASPSSSFPTQSPRTTSSPVLVDTTFRASETDSTRSSAVLNKLSLSSQILLSIIFMVCTGFAVT